MAKRIYYSTGRLFRCIYICMCVYVCIFLLLYACMYKGKQPYTYACVYMHIYEVHTISFPTFFVWALLLIVHAWNSSPLRSNLLGCIALVVPFEQLLEGPIKVLLCEGVNDHRHNLFHLLNCPASELKEIPEVTGSKVWTIGRLSNCVDAHLGKIVCDKYGVMDWCIVLAEMPPTGFEECWPLATESLPELP